MMSKRFGRNQRRKLRATNDALSTALSAEKFFRARADERHARELEKAKDELGQTLAQVERWAEDIVHLAGTESAFNFHVRNFDVKNLRSLGPFLRLAPLSPVKRRAFSDAVPELHPVHVIDAAIYLAQVDQSFADKMRSIVRVRLSSVGDFLGYAFNTDRHQNLSPRDIDGIAEMIANEMAEFTRSA